MDFNGFFRRTQFVRDLFVQQFDDIFGINAKGLFFTVQKLLALVPDGGSIILNASIAASIGLAGFSVYSATKAAVRSFSRSWTDELKGRKIRVNTLSLGLIDTPIIGKGGMTQEQIKEFKATLSPLVPDLSGGNFVWLSV